MTLKTKRQLGTSVLRELRITGSLQNPAAEDLLRVTEKYDTKLEEWRGRGGLVYWTNSDLDAEEIPELVFDAVVDLMANEMAARFGRVVMTPAERLQHEEALLRRLRRLTALKSAELPTTISYM